MKTRQIISQRHSRSYIWKLHCKITSTSITSTHLTDAFMAILSYFHPLKIRNHPTPILQYTYNTNSPTPRYPRSKTPKLQSPTPYLTTLDIQSSVSWLPLPSSPHILGSCIRIRRIPEAHLACQSRRWLSPAPWGCPSVPWPPTDSPPCGICTRSLNGVGTGG